jgi:hypothetical protein
MASSKKQVAAIRRANIVGAVRDALGNHDYRLAGCWLLLAVMREGSDG